MIYFDLDGVLRNLCQGIYNRLGISYQLGEWDRPVFPGGPDLCGYIDRNLEILIESPTTEYYRTARLSTIKGRKIDIMTCQPKNWQPNTMRWIEKYLPKSNVIFVDHAEDKINYLTSSDILIEDYPLFKDNSKVVIVDMPYNQGVKDCYKRIFTPRELLEVVRFNRHKESVIAYRTKNRKMGLCMLCGQPAQGAKQLCEKHGKKDSRFRLLRTRIQRQKYKDSSRCPRCSSPLDIDCDLGHIHCLNCRERKS